MLKFTYAYGYHLEDKVKGGFFEYLQGEAESGLERHLLQCVEKDLQVFFAFLKTRGSSHAGLTRVPNAKPERDSTEIEIFGMQGIPWLLLLLTDGQAIRGGGDARRTSCRSPARSCCYRQSTWSCCRRPSFGSVAG